MNQIAKRIPEEENWGYWSGAANLDWQNALSDVVQNAYKPKLGTVTNALFQVNVFMAHQAGGWSRMVEAAIRRHDGKPISWEDLQRIKNELFGRENEAVELFPAESRKVNMASNDQRRLWVKIKPGHTFPIGADRELTEKQRKIDLEDKRVQKALQKHLDKEHRKAWRQAKAKRKAIQDKSKGVSPSKNAPSS